MTLNLDQLTSLCRDAAAIRRVTKLQPAGGPGDKVFPPTYEGGVHAQEQRNIDGRIRDCVLLDSVQSQANRIEQSLLEAHESGELRLPVVVVDFAKAGLPDVGRVTSLDAPHRVADAILRDADLNGVPFRKSPVGAILDTATAADATQLFGVCPTALVFGVWDSTGPRGGLGTKFARALVSEIVAVDAVLGKKTSSRLDPLGIRADAGVLYVGKDGAWTLDEKLARKKGEKLGKKGSPAEANHGNIPPTIQDGGITFAYAQQVSVLSLASLRRLRFPDGKGQHAVGRDSAARVALAALALFGVLRSVASGLDLRSRCLLVPESSGSTAFEVIGVDGAITKIELNAREALGLLKSAIEAAVKSGLPWNTEEVVLTPKPGLVDLVKKTRELSVDSLGEDA